MHQLVRLARQQQLEALGVGVMRERVRPPGLGDAPALVRAIEVVPRLLGRVRGRAVPGAVAAGHGEGLDVWHVLPR